MHSGEVEGGPRRQGGVDRPEGLLGRGGLLADEVDGLQVRHVGEEQDGSRPVREARAGRLHHAVEGGAVVVGNEVVTAAAAGGVEGDVGRSGRRVPAVERSGGDGGTGAGVCEMELQRFGLAAHELVLERSDQEGIVLVGHERGAGDGGRERTVVWRVRMYEAAVGPKLESYSSRSVSFADSATDRNSSSPVAVSMTKPPQSLGQLDAQLHGGHSPDDPGQGQIRQPQDRRPEVDGRGRAGVLEIFMHGAVGVAW